MFRRSNSCHVNILHTILELSPDCTVIFWQLKFGSHTTSYNRSETISARLIGLRHTSPDLQGSIKQSHERKWSTVSGINNNILVALLFPYPKEAKELWADQLHMGLVTNALNVNMIWTSVAWLLSSPPQVTSIKDPCSATTWSISGWLCLSPGIPGTHMRL